MNGHTLFLVAGGLLLAGSPGYALPVSGLATFSGEDNRTERTSTAHFRIRRKVR
jgi:hypothetical protein